MSLETSSRTNRIKIFLLWVTNEGLQGGNSNAMNVHSSFTLQG